MKRFTKLMVATAVALTMGGTAAQAAVFISFNGVTTVHTDNTPGSYAFTAFNIGGFEEINVGGNTGILPVVLHSNTSEFNKTGPGAAHAKVYVTQTFLTGPFNSFLTSFSGSVGRGFSGSVKSYVSTANAKFTGVQIGTLTIPLCAANSCSIAHDDTSGSFAQPSAPYSVTHVYDISTTRRGSSTPSAITSTIVPEPATWALMIGGFAGAGAMLRRRRSLAAAA